MAGERAGEGRTADPAVGSVRAKLLDGDDLPELSRALQAARLPAEDLLQEGRLFWRFRDLKGRPCGYAGLEPLGDEALLRSVVVAAERRGQGLGGAIVDRTLREAASLGATRVWLLTDSAPGFFERLGFALAQRSAAPTRVAATREFSSLCPDDAVLMCRTLA
jgi:amino-acid N-acetyltransferase